MVPQKKDSPHRGILAIVGAFFGFAVCASVLFARRVWQDTDEDDDRKQFVRSSVIRPLLSTWPLRKMVRPAAIYLHEDLKR